MSSAVTATRQTLSLTLTAALNLTPAPTLLLTLTLAIICFASQASVGSRVIAIPRTHPTGLRTNVTDRHSNLGPTDLPTG